MTYRIQIVPTAFEALSAISDRRIRQEISSRIDRLSHEPEKQGKPLGGELTGFRSIRAVGQRYRIIYQVQASKVLVTIVMLGLRREGEKRDVYELAKKLIRLRLV